MPVRTSPVESRSSDPVRRSFGTQLLIVFIPAACFLSLLIFLISWKDLQATRQLLRRDELRHIEVQKMLLQNNLRSVIDDLSMLCNQRILKEFLEGNRRERLADVEDLLEDICRVKGYRRISLLDRDQDLLIRTTMGDPTTEVRSQATGRMDSQDTEYFNQVFQLGSNEVFMITFELSPSQNPGAQSMDVLRLGRAAFSGEGVREGVLVINCRVDDIVEEMRMLSRGTRGRLLLVNSAGNLVTRSYRELGMDQDVAELLPQTHQAVMGEEKGNLENRDGLVTWDKIYPFHRHILPRPGSGEELLPWIDRPDESQKIHWIIVSRIPRMELDQILLQRKLPYVTALILLNLLLAVGAWFLTLAVVKRKSAEQLARISHEKLAEKMKAIDFELELARNVMDSMLPVDLQRFKPLEVASFYRPSGEIGGDYYDLIRLPDGRVVFFLFDVVGHGVPAALNTAQARGSFQKSIFDGLSPARVLCAVNEHLLDQLGDNRFLTAFVGMIDEKKRILTCSCAACPSPWFVRCGEEPRGIRTGGTFIGLIPGFEFQEQEIPLQVGDRLVMFTDGLPEHRNAAGEMFGDENLLDSVIRHGALDLQPFVREIMADVDRFAGDRLQPDDITLLAVEFSEDPGSG